MATINSIYYNSPGKQLFINNSTNEFVVSGYRLSVDPNLNRDLLIVTTPQNTGDLGSPGNIAFDEHHLYYCISQNKWVRARLASWDKDQDIVAPASSIIRSPTHWWNLTSNSRPTIGNYTFITRGGSFSDEGYVTNNTNNTNNYLLNYSSNVVEPPTRNESFSISFELAPPISRGFVLGSKYGLLGFDFSFANTSIPKLQNQRYPNGGNNLQFCLNSSIGPAYYGRGNFERWHTVGTTSSWNTVAFKQVVATYNASIRQMMIYVNGTLEGSYTFPGHEPLFAYGHNINPTFQGFGIGASPYGSYFGTPVDYVVENSPVKIRYLGLWKNIVLNQTEISSIYNGGSFKRYPFL